VPSNGPRNRLYYGDNLKVLRRHVQDESVDLVYLDPPFKSNQNYNVLFQEQDGTRSAAQVKAFTDTWRWDQAAAGAFQEVVESGGRISQALQAFRTFLGESDMMAYLSMMAPRLKELWRVLKPTGSLYLHCDPTASHYLKMLLDAVFEPQNFRNELAWHYKKFEMRKMGHFTRNSDRLLFFVKDAGKEYTYRPQEIQLKTPKQYKRKAWSGKLKRIVNVRDDAGKLIYDTYTHEKVDDVWEIPFIGATARERLGYPTQKPEALLERIIKASSSEGDLVLDPFCGCGTAVAVAQRLKRRWIGIDITHLALNLIKHRLVTAFGDAVRFKVTGEPESRAGAVALAQDDPYQFQFWALGLVGARPAEEKKGADKGIDGRRYFFDESGAKAKPKQIIFSVKAGHLTVPYLRDLRGVLDREGAELGALLSMRDPTGPMRKEAASAGFYKSPWDGKPYPRLQLLTVGDLLAGKKPDFPPSGRDATFKQAPRIKAKAGETGRLV